MAPEIADDIAAVDGAMRNGYNWKYGPFELIDRLGAGYLAERLAREKLPVPPLIAKAAEAGGFYREREGDVEELGFDGGYRPIAAPAGVLLLADIKRAGKPLAANGSASLWDIGDGVACLEFHSKMNSIDPDSFQLLRQSLDLVAKRKLKALVIYNEGENFSVGLNLGLALFSANLAMWAMIEDMVATGQQTYKTIKYSAFPVVGAPSGMALGGGCEILLHCAAVVAHAESYIGLVEAGVGLVPGWGGCKELLARSTAHPKRPWPHAAGGRDLRDHLHRQGRPLRRRGEAAGLPRSPRRDRHEPRPASGRREGEGAGSGGGLSAARAHELPPAGSLGQGGPHAGRRQFRPAGQGHRL